MDVDAAVAVEGCRAPVFLQAVGIGGGLELDVGSDPAVARRQLLALKGIGPWTADYVGELAKRTPVVFAFVLGLSFLC